MATITSVSIEAQSPDFQKLWKKALAHTPKRAAWADAWWQGRARPRLSRCASVLGWITLAGGLVAAVSFHVGGPSWVLWLPWLALVYLPLRLGVDVMDARCRRYSSLGMGPVQAGAIVGLVSIQEHEEIRRMVCDWLERSGDAALTGPELKILEELNIKIDGDRFEKSMALSDVKSSPLVLSEDFYKGFPSAPRFRNPSEEFDSLFWRFQRVASLLDHMLGHLEVGKARAAAKGLNEVVPLAPQAPARTRF